jgi:hypothetical protein
VTRSYHSISELSEVASGFLRREVRGDGRLEAPRVDALVGQWQRRGSLQFQRVGVPEQFARTPAFAAAGDGLQAHGLDACRRQQPEDRGGDRRLADAGVGAGDEEAGGHGKGRKGRKGLGVRG